MYDKLKTIWHKGEWRMFILHAVRNIETPHSTIKIPDISDIQRDPIYQKYISTKLKNIERGVSRKGKTIRKDKPDYHRLFLLAAAISVLSLSVGFIRLFPPGVVGNIFGYICFGVGVVCFFVAICLFFHARRSRRKYEHLSKLLLLIEQIEEAQEEIKIKNKLINKLIHFMEVNFFLGILPDNKKNSLRGFIALAFDKKDSLKFYENASATLDKLAKLKTLFYPNRQNRQTILNLTIFELLKAKFWTHKDHYQLEADNFFKAKNFDELMNKLVSDNEPQQEKIFVFGILGEIFQDENSIKSLIDITFWLNNICKLSLEKTIKDSELTPIKIFYDCFLISSNFGNLHASILMLLEDTENIKQQKILEYINAIFSKSYHDITAVFEEEDEEQLKTNIETISNVLESRHNPIWTTVAADVSQKSTVIASQPRSEDVIKLTIDNNAFFFQKDRQGYLQEGWNCGDIALNIKRDWLVKTLLEKSDDKKLRLLLAPEIKTAIAEGADKVIFGAYAEEAKRYFRAYQEAHDNMDDVVALCNIKLGNKKDQYFSLQELECFFESIENQERYPDAWQLLQENRAVIFTPIENAFNAYCQNKSIFEQYVNGYYCKNQWMVYHPIKAGRINTSIIDAVAYLVKAKVYVLVKNDHEELVIDHETESNGNKKIFMFYNGHDHFTKLIPISESDYNAAVRNMQTSQAGLITLHSGIINNFAPSNEEQPVAPPHDSAQFKHSY